MKIHLKCMLNKLVHKYVDGSLKLELFSSFLNIYLNMSTIIDLAFLINSKCFNNSSMEIKRCFLIHMLPSQVNTKYRYNC